MEMHLTEESYRLFIEFAQDAVNWNGQPLINGNVSVSKKQRGNLSDLIQKGLILVEQDSKRDGGDAWVIFTDAGVDFAASCGVDVA